MNELHFDFSQDARRSSILAQLQAACEARGISSDVSQRVQAAGIPEGHHHDMAAVTATIAGLAGISEKVRADMLAIYTVLNEAEATAHGVSPAETHFHEVGRSQGIANCLQICLLLEALAPQRITASAVQSGSGKIECAHGLMDIPAPATAAIIARGIPVCGNLLDGELCTPTSAAIIYHFVDEYRL